MKKLLMILFVTTLFAACQDNFGDTNVDTKKPPIVPPAALFVASQKALVDQITSSNVNSNIFRLISQYWTEATYFDEANYDLTTRNIPQNFWNTLYTGVLQNLKESQRLIPTQDLAFVPAAQQKNQNACAEILNVYTYSVLINTFGNVPYTEALNSDNVYPKYDDATAIYDDLFVRLDKALNDIDVNSGGFGKSDLFYGGDMGAGMAGWVTFGNSLKLRLGMIIADVNPAKAKTIVEQAAPKAISSNAENVVFKYLSSPPNTNPIWVDLVQSGRKDFVATHTIVDTMLSLNDPRVPFYFTVDSDTLYSGGIPGQGNNYSTYSKPSTRITAPDFESLLMDYAEVEFLRAEAIERGMNVGGTAAEHYNNAIRASITYWGGSIVDANAYLAQSDVAYATAPGADWKAKIGLQKWLALYNRGFDGWVEIRRLDNPQLPAPSDPNSGYPARFTYPVQEQTLNADNYARGSTSIGGDVVETKLFWDKF